MQYRIRFSRSRKRRKKTSKSVRRISSTKVKAIDPGKKVVLSARSRIEAPDGAPAAKPLARQQPPPPRSLDERFGFDTIVHRAGSTTMVSATERKAGRLFTLTTHELSGSSDWASWDRFKHGCQVLRSLRHARVPTYVEHDERGSIAYLLTERIEGRSLEEQMQRGERFTDAKLRHLLEQGLEVLTYLHELNPPVFHGDIHPGTVFVSQRGKLTLTTFDHSASRLAGDSSQEERRAGYTAPERELESPGAASDVFALAATLLAVACGRDAALLPRRNQQLDIESCMRPSPLRNDLASLVHPDAQPRMMSADRLSRRRSRPLR